MKLFQKKIAMAYIVFVLLGINSNISSEEASKEVSKELPVQNWSVEARYLSYNWNPELNDRIQEKGDNLVRNYQSNNYPLLINKGYSGGNSVGIQGNYLSSDKFWGILIGHSHFKTTLPTAQWNAVSNGQSAMLISSQRYPEYKRWDTFSNVFFKVWENGDSKFYFGPGLRYLDVSRSDASLQPFGTFLREGEGSRSIGLDLILRYNTKLSEKWSINVDLHLFSLQGKYRMDSFLEANNATIMKDMGGVRSKITGIEFDLKFSYQIFDSLKLGIGINSFESRVRYQNYNVMTISKISPYTFSDGKDGESYGKEKLDLMNTGYISAIFSI